MKIAKRLIILTRYNEKFASSRLRIYKFIPLWEQTGWKVRTQNLFGSAYNEFIYSKKISIQFFLYLLWRFFVRILFVLFTPKRAIVVVQFEVLPFFPPIFEWYLKARGISYVLDFDDAFFHLYDESENFFIKKFLKNKFSKIVTWANWNIVGSPYLTQYATLRNHKVTEIATGVEFEKYNRNDSSKKSEKVFVVGWIGSHYTSKYIDDISEVLHGFIKEYSVRLLLIGYKGDKFTKGGNVEIYEWDEKTEIDLLMKINVGIMPLRYDAFSKGKCGFKLIQYMACGKPTISTPLEANIKIDNNNGNLFAVTHKDWIASLKKVMIEKDFFFEVGQKNKETVRRNYDIKANSSKYIEIFEAVRLNKEIING